MPEMELMDVIHQPGDLQVDEEVSKYIKAATSDNTRLAYQNDIRHFEEQRGSLPTTPEIIVEYLQECVHTLNPRTLRRRMTALRQWHKLKGFEDPTDNPSVRRTISGISRLHGKPRKQALALRLEDLDRMVGFLDEKGDAISFRNRALLLVGFFGALRRSELISLKWEDVQFVTDGMIVTLPRSKTDQMGEGTRCVIPFGNESRCPVRALIDWRQASHPSGGLIFRRISKTGTISEKGISPRHWNRILRQLAKDIGLPNPEQFSSHSLRRGFATEASRLGASMPSIQRHGRWRSTKTVLEYIEAGRQFADSAVNVLFKS